MISKKLFSSKARSCVCFISIKFKVTNVYCTISVWNVLLSYQKLHNALSTQFGTDILESLLNHFKEQNKFCYSGR